MKLSPGVKFRKILSVDSSIKFISVWWVGCWWQRNESAQPRIVDARTKQETRSALPSPPICALCPVRQGLDTIIDRHFDELGRGAATQHIA